MSHPRTASEWCRCFFSAKLIILWKLKEAEGWSKTYMTTRRSQAFFSFSFHPASTDKRDKWNNQINLYSPGYIVSFKCCCIHVLPLPSGHQIQPRGIVSSSSYWRTEECWNASTSCNLPLARIFMCKEPKLISIHAGLIEAGGLGAQLCEDRSDRLPGVSIDSEENRLWAGSWRRWIYSLLIRSLFYTASSRYHVVPSRFCMKHRRRTWQDSGGSHTAPVWTPTLI